MGRETRGWNRRQVLVAGGALMAGWAAAGPPARGRSDGAEDRVSALRPPGRDELEARIERARKIMAELGVGALFVEATTNLRYFAGISWWPSERLFGVLIPRRGELQYVAPAFEEGRARDRLVVGGDLRVWQEHESPYSLVAAMLGDLGLGSASIAMDPAARYFLYRGLAEAAGSGRWVDGSPVVDGCRGRKTALELALMRRANEITQDAIGRAARGARTGMTQGDVAGMVREAHVAAGAAPGWALVLFGPNAAYPHGTDADYRLRPGDVLLMDCGTEVHGYQSDITRTFVFGAEATPRQRRMWTAVQTAQRSAFAAIAPGVPCGEIDRLARLRIEAAGFGRDYEAFTHRLGHGIGMQGHEWPYLVRGNGLALAPGMTFSNEPGIYLPGELGVRLEDIVHVTPEGAEWLSEPVRELETVGV